MPSGADALRQVNSLYAVLAGRRSEIERQFDYFNGKQPLAYASEQWKTAHEDRYRNFADNWCGVVARSPVDRLRIDGFRLSEPVDGTSREERLLWDDWNRNELGAQSNQGFLTSTVAKRSAVLVWGNSDDEPEVTWEHPSQVVVAYSPTGRRNRLAALKAWTDGDTEYATLYLPHEVWKWQRPTYVSQRGETVNGLYVPGWSLSEGGWQPREIAGEQWPLPNPLGVVPIVEWLNRPDLTGQPISDISGTMAMQDAINMLWAYLFASADYASMPARVVLGMEPPKVPILDESGQVVGSRPAKLEDLQKGRLLFLPGAQSIQQWDAAKLDVFGDVITDAIGHVAAQTSTPGHYLLTNEKFANLNGDALTAAEVPLATKVGNQQIHYNPSAKETAALMAQVRGQDGLAAQIRNADGRRFVQWKDATAHSPGQVADAATKDRAVGMSLRTVLERRYGMTEVEIDREMERIRAERTDPLMQAMLDEVRARAANTGLGA